jgi:hypothetical protein
VLLRLGEALQDRLFFWGALYEPVPDHPRHWAVSYSTRSNCKSTGRSGPCLVCDAELKSNPDMHDASHSGPGSESSHYIHSEPDSESRRGFDGFSFPQRQRKGRIADVSSDFGSFSVLPGKK